MKKATIFIPDISGFSRFVRDIDIDSGAYITATLLTAIVGSNRLFKVNEVEGDAVLFYREDEPCSVEMLLSQFHDMLVAFNLAKKKLDHIHPGISELTLKAIAHYGEIAEYSINNNTKLYGPTLVEAHRLLKNNIQHNTYVLMTEDFLDCAGGYLDTFTHQCELYDIGKLCFAFIACTQTGKIAA